ncbi:hypothetical protein EK21DRAFT_100472 [Setomelanomma holmii]|uniref:Uncharacterized protein n=1 Tax=Setomelanomma holmii TaxID=210430 RepID=A0A9P4H8U9_9PLEO|nr:hypothetical protein EK21DRAFT_100472 [Setomelanomma holmii]
MQHQRFAPSRCTPPPDVVRAPPTLPPPDIGHRPTSTPSHPPRLSPQPSSEFLIVGLFALRLTTRLIETLEHYPDRDADIAWITNFLRSYPSEYALAKISAARKQDYLASYQAIVSRMKKQPRYPMRFMQMNPDRSIRQRIERSEADREYQSNMTDLERLDLIDFCDAAGEWGSIVPIPAREADRMIELANQRRIADLDERRPSRDDRRSYEEWRSGA